MYIPSKLSASISFLVALLCTSCIHLMFSCMYICRDNNEYILYMGHVARYAIPALLLAPFSLLVYSMRKAGKLKSHGFVPACSEPTG